jgi:hypothetical protein
MLVDVKPGNTVSVKVRKTPTNQAAAKTISRLLAKDPGGRKARMERKKLLRYASERRRRGGRIWVVRPKAPALFSPTQGASCTLLATSDVIKDLRSVERFIEVSAATQPSS